jgi:predicted adenine nucleotide alpha hydrolase (AANH) superfamily ATPase
MQDSSTLLLHVCCGPCAAGAIERLKNNYLVTLFFSNSNIWPEQEYRKRLDAARKLAHALGLPLVEDNYDHSAWLSHVRGFEEEPEGGSRCELCFGFNLLRTAEYARQHNFDHVATTLTISPHKSSATIFTVGEQIEGFLPIDFKKKDGFKRSIELSKNHNLYRQNYCGCEFSHATTGSL